MSSPPAYRGRVSTYTADQVAAAWLDANERLFRLSPQTRLMISRGSVSALVSGAALPSMNAVVALTADPDPAALGELAAEVTAVGVPWSLIVRGEPGDAVAALAAAHGLHRRGGMPLLACTAADAVLTAEEKPIRPVWAADADTYTEVLEKAFELPGGTFGTLMGGDVLDAPEHTGYLSGHDATGLGVRGNGMIGVFNIAVVPEARGQGLGRAMTSRVLADGFTAGASTAYLHTSEAGRPLYESMGFRLLETWTAFTA